MTPLTLQLLLQVEERQHVRPCHGRHHLETTDNAEVKFQDKWVIFTHETGI